MSDELNHVINTQKQLADGNGVINKLKNSINDTKTKLLKMRSKSELLQQLKEQKKNLLVSNALGDPNSNELAEIEKQIVAEQKKQPTEQEVTDIENTLAELSRKLEEAQNTMLHLVHEKNSAISALIRSEAEKIGSEYVVQVAATTQSVRKIIALGLLHKEYMPAHEGLLAVSCG